MQSEPKPRPQKQSGYNKSKYKEMVITVLSYMIECKLLTKRDFYFCYHKLQVSKLINAKISNIHYLMLLSNLHV